MDHGLFEAALLAEHDGEIVVRVRIIGAQRQRALERRPRLVPPALLVQRMAEPMKRRGILRGERHGLAAVLDRLVVTADRLIGHGDVGVKIRQLRIECDRPADQLDRGRVPAGLVGDDAEEMQAVGVVRIDIEHLPVEPLRLGELPGLMPAERKRREPAQFGAVTLRVGRGLDRGLDGGAPLFSIHATGQGSRARYS